MPSRFALLPVLFGTAFLTAQDPVALPASLQIRLAKAASPELRWPDWTDYRALVQACYALLGGQLAWSRGGVPTPQARAIADILGKADLKGLDADAYGGAEWSARMAALSPGSGPALEAFDVAFTVSVMRYLSDLRLGRINPARLGQGFGGGHRRAFLPEVTASLTTDPEPGPRLEEGQPAFPGYRALLAQLPRYLELSRQPFKTLRPVQRLAPGNAYPEAQALASLLVALGDLSPEEAKTLPGGSYPPALAAAVTRYQARHSLAANGLLGPKTLAQLNVPLTQRLSQIRLTLERWRWAELEPSPRMILVNIPAFNLSALSATSGGYQTDFWMKVVVGKAVLHETHLLTGRMEAIIFRPTWDVPSSILVKDILPKLRKHPSLLGREGYAIVPAAGAGMPARTVTPALLKGLATGRLRLFQKPGPRNALGNVKFLFSNPFQLYLHDTPARTAFGSVRRDFSHGCIRLEHPAELATWVLQGLPGWDVDRVSAELAAEGPPFKVPIVAPIQVVLVYGTATVDGEGRIYFYDDIYGNDKQLAQALAAGYPYRW